MACESDKCEKYGLHHDYEDGKEVMKCHLCRRDNQPERSKREDSLIREIVESSKVDFDKVPPFSTLLERDAVL